MERHAIAYLLFVLMGLAIAAVLSFKLYHSRDRAYRRRVKRERVDHDRVMGERADK